MEIEYPTEVPSCEEFEKEISEYGEKANFQAIRAACRFIQHWVDGAESLPEPIWYAGLSIVGRTEKGHEVAHEASSKHPKYTKEETERKLQQALAASGPVTCNHISKIGFDGCLSCPLFYSKNLKSPISLGCFDVALAELLGRYAYSIQTAQFAEVGR